RSALDLENQDLDPVRAPAIREEHDRGELAQLFRRGLRPRRDALDHLEKGPPALGEDRVEDLFLVAEVVIDEPIGDPGLACDVRHARSVVAAGREDARRRVEDLLALGVAQSAFGRRRRSGNGERDEGSARHAGRASGAYDFAKSRRSSARPWTRRGAPGHQHPRERQSPRDENAQWAERERSGYSRRVSRAGWRTITLGVLLAMSSVAPSPARA